MLSALLGRFFSKKSVNDDDMLDAYGNLLENCGLYESITKLPASKTRIKDALLRQAQGANEAELQAILVCYLSLANFQDTNLDGVTHQDLQIAADKSGDDMVQAVLKLGPKIKNTEVLGEMINLERRALAREWEVAAAGFGYHK